MRMLALHKRRNLRISAIVPAYNEAANLPAVLAQLRRVPAIREIIVVSDGSSDDTARVAAGFAGVRVLALPENVGKTRAVLQGVAAAVHPTLLFCDADLVNLSETHLREMLEAYRQGYAMVIMDKGSQPWIFRDLLRSAPAVSGTRVLSRRHLMQVPFKHGDRFQFEVRINDYFLARGLPIAITPAAEVYDPRKFIKYPFREGLLLDIRGGWQVLASDGPRSIFKNLAAFWRISALTRRKPAARRADRVETMDG